MISFRYLVEVDFSRPQREVFAFLEDPQSLIEAGLATSVTGSVGRRGRGTLIFTDGSETTFRVKRCDPPNRTVIDHMSHPAWAIALNRTAAVKLREENRYMPTPSGCRLVRGVRVEMINLQTNKPNGAELLRQESLQGTTEGLNQLQAALLRHGPPSGTPSLPGEVGLRAQDPDLNE